MITRGQLRDRVPPDHTKPSPPERYSPSCRLTLSNYRLDPLPSWELDPDKSGPLKYIFIQLKINTEVVRFGYRLLIVERVWVSCCTLTMKWKPVYCWNEKTQHYNLVNDPSIVSWSVASLVEPSNASSAHAHQRADPLFPWYLPKQQIVQILRWVQLYRGTLRWSEF